MVSPVNRDRFHALLCPFGGRDVLFDPALVDWFLTQSWLFRTDTPSARGRSVYGRTLLRRRLREWLDMPLDGDDEGRRWGTVERWVWSRDSEAPPSPPRG